MLTLEQKGFTIIDNNGILRLVKINDASKYNLPVVSQTIGIYGSLIGKTVEVVNLKNADVKAIVTIINGIITNKQYKNSNDKPYVSSDEESNSIILMGQKDELKYYKELIQQLDSDRQQVYVQARIIEVSEKGIKMLV